MKPKYLFRIFNDSVQPPALELWLNDRAAEGYHVHTLTVVGVNIQHVLMELNGSLTVAEVVDVAS
jgi:hypothetical protein